MHKRSEDEIREAQEQKNYLDFVYQTNQSINNLSEAISILSKEIKSLRYDLERTIVDITSTTDDYSDGLLSAFHMHKSDMGDHKTENDAKLRKFRDELEILSEDCLRKEDASKIFNQMYAVLDLQDQMDKEIVSELHNMRRLFEGALKSAIDDVRKDLKVEKPEKDPLTEEVRSIVDAIKTDFSGLQREIEIIKKANRYTEKKFEMVFTELDKLKGA